MSSQLIFQLQLKAGLKKYAAILKTFLQCSRTLDPKGSPHIPSVCASTFFLTFLSLFFLCKVSIRKRVSPVYFLPFLSCVLQISILIFFLRYPKGISHPLQEFSIDIYTETRCPTPLCNTWKCIAYRAPYKLVKEWLICDKLSYIYRNFFYFFVFLSLE